MVPFGGWSMPLAYKKGQLAEHAAVRTHAGVFDVSHMGQVRLRGARALELLDLLVPGDVSGLRDGRSRYTCLCTPNGGVVDDLIVSRVSGTEAFAVLNAANREKDVDWMRAHAARLGFGDVVIEDESDRWAMIAFQGPAALHLLTKLLPAVRVDVLPPFTFVRVSANLILSMTGYTGERGAEILCRPEDAPAWWDRLMAVGGEPAGLAARDSLRLEMGYPLHGQDLSEDISPLEGGIGWTVSWKKKSIFLGREALERQKADGVPRKRIGLLAGSRRPLRADLTVTRDGTEIGRVTSGGYSPTLERGISLALVDATASLDGALEVGPAGGKGVSVEVHSLPFVGREK